MTAHIFKRKRLKNGVVTTSRVYYGRYKLDGENIVTTVNLGVTDKQVAEQKLRQLVIGLERERAGLCVPKAVNDCLNASLPDLIEEYVGELESIGRTQEQTRHVSARLTTLQTAGVWRSLRDVPLLFIRDCGGAN